jgi:multidrug efflux pump subunit AcrB
VLLRQPKKPEPTIEERRECGFYGTYNRLAGRAIRWRWAVLALSLLFLIGGGVIATRLESQFFPEDVQYWSYDVWLPNDAPLSLANNASQHVESVIRKVVKEYEQGHSARDSPALLESVTTFLGGGGPRFWFSVAPEQQQQNYAQVLIQLSNKEATPESSRNCSPRFLRKSRAPMSPCTSCKPIQWNFLSRCRSPERPTSIRLRNRPITSTYECWPAEYKIFCDRSAEFKWYRTTGFMRAQK